jgi:hypothetical protein
MSHDMSDMQDLHDLVVELMETLVIVGKRFFDYAREHNMNIEGIESLSQLIGRAQHLLETISNPYVSNPIISDASYQQNSSDGKLSKSKRPPDKLPVYLGEGVPSTS